MLREKSRSGYELYITDNSRDDYLDEFMWSIETDYRNTNSLVDDPFTYSRLSALKFKYAILWLKDDVPFMGWFLTQYKNLPSNVVRCFCRWYKLSTSKDITMRFLQEEHQMYAKHLQPLLDADNIDTVFFTRHLSTKKDMGKWKNKKRVKIGMGERADIKWTESKFRNIEQTIYYFSTWKFYDKMDESFLSKLDKA